MARTRMLIAPRCVQCRTCANYLGRVGWIERRVSDRTCAAGHDGDPLTISCESYVAARDGLSTGTSPLRLAGTLARR